MLEENTPFDTSKAVLQKLELDLAHEKGFDLYVKRDDLIHDLVSGNKWRKLKYNVAQAQQNKAEGIFTFGGAYSNHLLATAAACKLLGLKSIGFVRGEELHPDANNTLRQCSALGMELIFLERQLYAMRNDFEFLKELKNDHPNFYAVPEGGANFYGMIGCQEILREIPFTPDHIFIAQGTTATSCGILLSKKPKTQLHLVPVLKGFDSKKEMLALLNLVNFDDEISTEYFENCVFHPDFHFGAYGKYTDELIRFIREIYQKHKLPLDHVYTGKAFYAMCDWLKNEKDLEGKKIVFIHTGGLQASDFYKSSGKEVNSQ